MIFSDLIYRWWFTVRLRFLLQILCPLWCESPNPSISKGILRYLLPHFILFRQKKMFCFVTYFFSFSITNWEPKCSWLCNKNKKKSRKRNIERKKMYFCKLIIKCIVYDRLRKQTRQNVKEQGGYHPAVSFSFVS